jgi:hypothetical protein
MQGLRKEPRPARKLTSMFTTLSEEIFPPIDVPKFRDVRIFVSIWKFAITLSSPVKISIPIMTRITPKKYWK